MEKEMTMEELVSFIKKKEGDFIIHVVSGKENMEDEEDECSLLS